MGVRDKIILMLHTKVSRKGHCLATHPQPKKKKQSLALALTLCVAWYFQKNS